MTNYVAKRTKANANDIDFGTTGDSVGSGDIPIDSQSAYTLDDFYDDIYGPTIYPADILAKQPVVDVRAFGAVGDGTTDDTTAIQDAINYAGTNRIGEVFIPAGNYKVSRLYLHYDATNNPGYPSDTYLQGRVHLRGQGAVTTQSINANELYGTRIVSTDATGPVIHVSGNVSSAAAVAQRSVISNMTVDGFNSTYVVKFEECPKHSGMRDCCVVQRGSGGGILHLNGGWYCWYINLDITQEGSGGTGLRVYSDSSHAAGGGYQFTNMSIVNFDVGFHFGPDDYTDSDKSPTCSIGRGLSTSDCAIGGVFSKTQGFDLNRSFIEGSSTAGLRVMAESINVEISGHFFANAVDIEVGDGGGTNDRAKNVTIRNTYHQSAETHPTTTFIRVHDGAGLSNVQIIKPYFYYVTGTLDHAIEITDARYRSLKVADPVTNGTITQIIADSGDNDMSHRLLIYEPGHNFWPGVTWSSENLGGLTDVAFKFLNKNQAAGAAVLGIDQQDTDQSAIDFVRYACGTLKMWTYQNDTEADDAYITLMPDAVAGFVFVSCNAEAGMWVIQNDGTCNKVAGTANTDDANTDATLCVYQHPGETKARIRNRLGAAGELRAVYFYN